MTPPAHAARLSLLRSREAELGLLLRRARAEVVTIERQREVVRGEIAGLAEAAIAVELRQGGCEERVTHSPDLAGSTPAPATYRSGGAP